MGWGEERGWVGRMWEMGRSVEDGKKRGGKRVGRGLGK